MASPGEGHFGQVSWDGVKWTDETCILQVRSHDDSSNSKKAGCAF